MELDDVVDKLEGSFTLNDLEKMGLKPYSDPKLTKEVTTLYNTPTKKEYDINDILVNYQGRQDLIKEENVRLFKNYLHVYAFVKEDATHKNYKSQITVCARDESGRIIKDVNDKPVLELKTIELLKFMWIRVELYN